MNDSTETEAMEAGGVPKPVPRCGYVTIVGRPNAGKSTLMNALLGEHLSIVTPLAQTTWVPVQGILSRGTSDSGYQMIFLDTPGLLSDPASLIHESLLEAVAGGIREADVVLLLLDPTRPVRPEERETLGRAAQGRGRPLVVAVNKCDVAAEVAIERECAWARETLGSEPLRISAAAGDGIRDLEARLAAALPEGPFLFPEDEIATAPVRFFVAELVREAIFELLTDELPWSVLPKVEAFKEGGTDGGGRTFIQVVLHVEKASQKGILVGEGGKMIRKIGTRARGKVEAFLGEPVYLELWVKVLPRWRKKRGELRRMGLPVPEAPRGR